MEQFDIILSVLICSLRDRGQHLASLLDNLHSQIQKINFNKSVEILVETDDGEIHVGSKRNMLLNKSRGKHVCFIDDDDDVSDDYINAIIDALVHYGPDCVGMQGLLVTSTMKFLFCHSIQFQNWYTGSDGVFYRTPNHLNPVKRKHALSVGFPSVSFGEDKFYSDNIRPYLKKEIYIDHPIYFYNKKDMQ